MSIHNVMPSDPRTLPPIHKWSTMHNHNRETRHSKNSVHGDYAWRMYVPFAEWSLRPPARATWRYGTELPRKLWRRSPVRRGVEPFVKTPAGRRCVRADMQCNGRPSFSCTQSPAERAGSRTCPTTCRLERRPHFAHTTAIHPTPGVPSVGVHGIGLACVGVRMQHDPCARRAR